MLDHSRNIKCCHKVIVRRALSSNTQNYQVEGNKRVLWADVDILSLRFASSSLGPHSLNQNNRTLLGVLGVFWCKPVPIFEWIKVWHQFAVL
jgi:hypothetical protein